MISCKRSLRNRFLSISLLGLLAWLSFLPIFCHWICLFCLKMSLLRRISCYGRNHSHTRCDFLQTILLCYHHYSEYSLLGSKFQLVCYSQRVNATSQYNDSGSSRCSKWSNDRMVVVVKHCWLLVQGRTGCKERWLKTTTRQVFKRILACSVSRRVIVIVWFSCLCMKGQLGLCSLNCQTDAMTGNCTASYRVLANSLRVVSAMRENPPSVKSWQIYILSQCCSLQFLVT